MATTEVEEKSSRAIAEEAFHVKLGPRPAFPPSQAGAGQTDGEVIARGAMMAGARGQSTER